MYSSVARLMDRMFLPGTRGNQGDPAFPPGTDDATKWDSPGLACHLDVCFLYQILFLSGGLSLGCVAPALAVCLLQAAGARFPTWGPDFRILTKVENARRVGHGSKDHCGYLSIDTAQHGSPPARSRPLAALCERHTGPADAPRSLRGPHPRSLRSPHARSPPVPCSKYAGKGATDRSFAVSRGGCPGPASKFFRGSLRIIEERLPRALPHFLPRFCRDFRTPGRFSAREGCNRHEKLGGPLAFFFSGH